MNAMIARAMEVCHAKGMRYLVYSKFSFGNKKHDDMAEFKQRNGFVQLTSRILRAAHAARANWVCAGAAPGSAGRAAAGRDPRLVPWASPLLGTASRWSSCARPRAVHRPQFS